MSNNNKNTNCWRREREGKRGKTKWMRGKNKRTIKVFPFNIFPLPSLHFIIFAFHPCCCVSFFLFLLPLFVPLTQKKGRQNSFFWLGELLWRPITFMPILARENKNEAKNFSVLMTRDYELKLCFFSSNF